MSQPKRKWLLTPAVVAPNICERRKRHVVAPPARITALEHRVRNRAAVPKRAHTSGLLALDGRLYHESTLRASQRSCHVGVQSAELRIRRSLPVEPDEQRCQPCHASGRFGVTEIGLNAARSECAIGALRAHERGD